MLIGIVLRGTAFVFRTYDDRSDEVQRGWGRLFAGASIVTPVMLGVVVGAVASGRLRADPLTGRIQSDFFSSWLTPFAFAIGLFALALFAFLAAVYLTLEARDPALQDDFRKRALLAAVGVGLTAALSFALSGEGAPLIRAGLAQQRWSLPFQLLTGVVALGAMGALWQRRFRLARLLAIAQVVLILWGWGMAQFPYLIVPDLTFANTAAPDNVLQILLIALVAGMVVLAPSLWYLFRVFKGQQEQEAFEAVEGGAKGRATSRRSLLLARGAGAARAGDPWSSRFGRRRSASSARCPMSETLQG